MSTLVALSDDLQRLLGDGYDVEVSNGDLLVHHIPFVTADGRVEYGVLAAELSSDGTRTTAPSRHEMWLIGGLPYDHQDNALQVIIDPTPQVFGEGLVSSCRISLKPRQRMPVDYYERVTIYARYLSQYARAVDPNARHDGYPARATSADESVFRYHDAATSRAGLTGASQRLKTGPVAIVGLGGTGSYVLDLVAKTPVTEVHLFDDDHFLAHNAFRAPAAASHEEVASRGLKVDYFQGVYDKIRRGIVPHPYRVDETTVHELDPMSFVFLSLDAGPGKRLIVEHLISHDIPFTDCGIGVTRNGDVLRGTARVDTGLPGLYEHIPRRLSYTDVDNDEYAWNMQTADLNMLSAVLAVIKWKKYHGYYADSTRELHSSYTVASNLLINAEELNDD